jgi:muramoyltetrapeptide carboxypeptidase
VATHLLGTAAEAPLDGAIVALEDVGEAPYRLDRLLTQWRMQRIFDRVAGIALGRFSQCDELAKLPSFTVAEVLRDRLSDLGIPVVSDLPFGHDGPNAALPVGVPVELDGDRGVLAFGDGRSG